MIVSVNIDSDRYLMIQIVRDAGCGGYAEILEV